MHALAVQDVLIEVHPSIQLCADPLAVGALYNRGSGGSAEPPLQIHDY